MPADPRYWQYRPANSAVAQAAPNMAFIKYRDNGDNAVRLPMNGFIAMDLDELTTRAMVDFQDSP